MNRRGFLSALVGAAAILVVPVVTLTVKKRKPVAVCGDFTMGFGNKEVPYGVKIYSGGHTVVELYEWMLTEFKR